MLLRPDDEDQFVTHFEWLITSGCDDAPVAKDARERRVDWPMNRAHWASDNRIVGGESELHQAR